jgi:hypothetical protein
MAIWKRLTEQHGSHVYVRANNVLHHQTAAIFFGKYNKNGEYRYTLENHGAKPGNTSK